MTLPSRLRPLLVPLAVSVVVLASAAAEVPAVRDATTLAEVSEARLVRPLGYVAMAPLSNVLDALTLLSVRQHIALFLGALVLLAGVRALVRGPGRRHGITFAGFLGAVVVLYLAAIVMPRPMAMLETSESNILRVDFHSHTSASHDGRAGWNAERNRDWHRDAGFDVAFITDHGTVDEAERGIAANPNPAAEGVTLLQGIEVTWAGEHVAIPGAERTYRGLLTPNHRDVDEQALRLASFVPGREPVVIWNHPKDLSRLPLIGAHPGVGIRALEIVNGAPDGMDKTRPNRARIAAVAQGVNAALTVGTDNHGWGRAAPGWTLMRIVGWRGMYGDSLALHVERAIREAGFNGTRPVERRVADPGGSVFQLAMSVFTVPWRMLTTLSGDERVVWLLWTWLLTIGVWQMRRRRATTVG